MRDAKVGICVVSMGKRQSMSMKNALVIDLWWDASFALRWTHDEMVWLENSLFGKSVVVVVINHSFVFLIDRVFIVEWTEICLKCTEVREWTGREGEQEESLIWSALIQSRERNSDESRMSFRSWLVVRWTILNTRGLIFNILSSNGAEFYFRADPSTFSRVSFFFGQNKCTRRNVRSGDSNCTHVRLLIDCNARSPRRERRSLSVFEQPSIIIMNRKVPRVDVRVDPNWILVSSFVFWSGLDLMDLSIYNYD